MFLVIFEDGEIKVARKLEQADFDAADNGLFDIIRIDDKGCMPKRFIDGEWQEVKLL
jgi:hypothetical protein